VVTNSSRASKLRLVLIVDAHLDLSYNALRGRDVLRPAREQRPDSEGIPSVGLPDLRAGGVGLVCATVFTMPSVDGKPGYHNPDEAHTEGLRHLDWYRRQIDAGEIRFVTTTTQIAALGSASENQPQHAILLLEGADPLRTPDDVAAWHAAGLRAVGLAWRNTRYAGGTGVPGPLSGEGVEMVKALDRFGIIHDASHLAEESFWQLLELSHGPLMASHSNCRTIVPTDRQLSDEMIRAIIERGGVIGINFFDRFLLPPDEYGKRRANLADVIAHVKHICDLAGNANHVGLGTDMDGGLGRDEIPLQIETSADLPRVAYSLAATGLDDSDVAKVMGGNWISFFARSLSGQ
jgi:membrane dipeptidase